MDIKTKYGGTMLQDKIDKHLAEKQKKNKEMLFHLLKILNEYQRGYCLICNSTDEDGHHKYCIVGILEKENEALLKNIPLADQ
jgi:hypothetical protein